MSKRPLIAIDFDGTLVAHEYPRVGQDIGAAYWLRRVADKVDFILLTMRDGEYLEEAVAWCKRKDIPLRHTNINPNQRRWTTSPKIFAHLYIDDAALGVPLVSREGRRPHVDWGSVGPMLLDWVNGKVF